MAELLSPAQLFFLTHGPNFMSHPAFSGAHEVKGSAGWKVAKLCDYYKKNPLEGIRLWQRHRDRLLKWPGVRNFYAFKYWEVDEDPDNAWVKTILN